MVYKQKEKREWVLAWLIVALLVIAFLGVAIPRLIAANKSYSEHGCMVTTNTTDCRGEK